MRQMGDSAGTDPAVDPLCGQPNPQPPVGDHGVAVLLPVWMLAPDRAEYVDEFFDRGVGGIGGDWAEFGHSLCHRIGPAPCGGDMEAGARIPPEVDRLGSAVGDR